MKLKDAVRRLLAERGAAKAPNQTCLLVLHVPVKRTADATPERYEARGFMIASDFRRLAIATGERTERDGYAVPIVGGVPVIAGR